MTIRKPITTLPDWAFKAIGSTVIATLIDRTEHETIVVTRKGRPDLVLVSHQEWEKLNAAVARRGGNTGQEARDAAHEGS